MPTISNLHSIKPVKSPVLRAAIHNNAAALALLVGACKKRLEEAGAIRCLVTLRAPAQPSEKPTKGAN